MPVSPRGAFLRRMEAELVKGVPVARLLGPLLTSLPLDIERVTSLLPLRLH